MNKKIFMSFALIALLSFAFIISANIYNIPKADGSTRKSEVELDTSQSIRLSYLHKGWNLVYGLVHPDQIEIRRGEENPIKAIFGFNSWPTEKKYHQLYPPSKKEEVSSLDLNLMLSGEREGKGDGKITQFINQPFWVYSSKDVEVQSFYFLKSFEFLEFNQRELYEGWNFFAYTGEGMYQKNFSEMSGNCVVEQTFWFDPKDQQWVSLSDELFMGEGGLLSGFVLKVKDNCRLGSINTGEITSPPQIPN
jgi:hypothetical protein